MDYGLWAHMKYFKNMCDGRVHVSNSDYKLNFGISYTAKHDNWIPQLNITNLSTNYLAIYLGNLAQCKSKFHNSKVFS